MKTLYHFFRLIRPVNLIVIALTMGVFQVFVIRGSDAFNLLPDFSQKASFALHAMLDRDFLILVLLTLLIASAGNIINDYFDVKADRINKPEKVVVGKHIKRRWAIVLNWMFNSVAFFLAAFLSWKHQNIWLLIIPALSINLLWLYSMYFKRKAISGNILVAILTASVPLLVGLFNPESTDHSDVLIIIGFYALAAFWLNLIREIVKDIADVKGDLRLGSSTLPIAVGIRQSKIITIVLFLLFLFSFLYIIYLSFGVLNNRQGSPDLIEFLLFVLCELSVVAALLVFIRATGRKKYLLSSNLLKLAMLFGLLSPLFL